jgi:hypothetical protein
MKNPDTFEKLCQIVQDTVIYVGDDPSLVKQFVKYLAPKNVAQGEEIIRQGDEGDYFYCIESGIYNVLVNGKQVSELDNKVFHLTLINSFDNGRPIPFRSARSSASCRDFCEEIFTSGLEFGNKGIKLDHLTIRNSILDRIYVIFSISIKN